MITNTYTLSKDFFRFIACFKASIADHSETIDALYSKFWDETERKKVQYCRDNGEDADRLIQIEMMEHGIFDYTLDISHSTEDDRFYDEVYTPAIDLLWVPCEGPFDFATCGYIHDDGYGLTSEEFKTRSRDSTYHYATFEDEDGKLDVEMVRVPVKVDTNITLSALWEDFDCCKVGMPNYLIRENVLEFLFFLPEDAEKFLQHY